MLTPALERSPLGVLIPGKFFPDGSFAVVLSLGLVQIRFVAPSDRKEAVHAD